MRRVALIACLLAPAALAHVVFFTFELPSTVRNYPGDAGVFTLTWVDQLGAGPKATASLLATRAALSPFEAPDASLLIATDVSILSPVDLYDWDTADAGAGCWQPYAVLDDPIEGLSVSKAEGRVTVVRGGNVPPAIWVTTPPTALPDRDALLTLHWDVDEPDDPSLTTVSWHASESEHGTLVSGLPLPAGTRTASYVIDVRRLPPRPVWLKIEITSGDAGWCDAWWRGFVTGRSDEPVDAGEGDGGAVDAGADAGEVLEADAGASPDAGLPTVQPRGCGCASGPPAAFSVSALLVARWRRRLTKPPR